MQPSWTIDRERSTITWNTVNAPRTGPILHEDERGFLVGTQDGKAILIPKPGPQRTDARQGEK